MKKLFRTVFLIPLLFLASCGHQETPPSVDPPTVEQVTIRFFDGRNEKPFKTAKVDKGSSFTEKVTAPGYSDKQYVYSFSSWDKSLENIMEDTDYYPEFSTSPVIYYVSFYDENVLNTYYQTEIHYKDKIEYKGETPTKPCDVKLSSYSFLGWSLRIDSRTWSEPYLTEIPFDWENVGGTTITLKANFELRRTAYEAVFKNEGEVIKRYEVGLEDILVYDGETPTKEGPEGIYTFTGWDKEIPTVPLTEDMEFNAEFSLEKYKYNVTFYDEDKTTILQQKVLEYGDPPTKGGIVSPKKESESIEYKYAFDGWKDNNGNSVSLSKPVTSDLEFYASYKRIDITWTVTFKGGGGFWATNSANYYTKKLENVYNGRTVELIEAPSHYDYGIKMIFIGYRKTNVYREGDTLYQPGEEVEVTSDLTFYGTWVKSDPPQPNVGVEYDYYGKPTDYTYEAKKAPYAKYEDYAIKRAVASVRDKDGNLHNAYTRRIAASGWKNDENVKRIYLPDSIRSIEKEAFWACKKLEYVEFNEGLQTIHENIFKYTDSLKWVVIPSTVTTVYDNLNSYSGRIAYFAATSLEGLPEVENGSTLVPNRRFDKEYSSDISKQGYALYSENEPAVADGFLHWHYVDGVPTLWKQQ